MPTARQLIRVAEPFHAVAYYCPEIKAFDDAGIRGWWHAYFAYRSAPLGEVPLDVVVDAFYNFAPAMVARAIPGVWSLRSPAEVLGLRLELVDRALQRVLDGRLDDRELRAAAALAREAAAGCDGSDRRLYAAHDALPWPDGPHLELWWATTLLREHRGDAHRLALRHAEVDGVACHLLMVAQGFGNRASILPIRGWTAEEWAAASEQLVERGWLEGDGSFTEAGRRARAAIEAHTDELASEPGRRLGDQRAEELIALLEPYVALAHERGPVPGRWPPPHLLREEPGR